MDNIIKMLQEKVGITKAQAEKVIELLKGIFGDSAEDMKDFRSKVSQKIEELEDEAESTADKTSDTLSEYIDKIRNMFSTSDNSNNKSSK